MPAFPGGPSISIHLEQGRSLGHMPFILDTLFDNRYNPQFIIIIYNSYGSQLYRKRVQIAGFITTENTEEHRELCSVISVFSVVKKKDF